MTDKAFRILAIDGGGIRGVYPAHILGRIEERLRVSLLDAFDLIAGTSTGAIVAAAIANGTKLEMVSELYRRHGPQIFTPKPLPWYVLKRHAGAFNSIYDSSRLEKQLDKIFGERTLADIAKPLMLPSTDISSGAVHVLKSKYHGSFVRDGGVKIARAVLASCSAPAYFDPTSIDCYLLADGGLWANNPALAATIDAIHRFNVDKDQIRVLSIGTGSTKTAYGRERRKWGLMNGWRGREFISFLLSLQSQTTNNYLKLLLKPSQLLRLDFDTDCPLPLDDVSRIDELITRADRCFTERSADLQAFFSD